MAFGQEIPEPFKAPDVVDADEEQPQAGDQQQYALQQVREDHRGLAAGELVRHAHPGDRDREQDDPLVVQPGESGQRRAESEEVDADVADQVHEQHQRRGDTHLGVEALREVLRHRHDAAEVEDREPAEHPQRHPEPVVEVCLARRDPVAESGRRVFHERIRADERRHARERDQPRREPLPGHEEVLRRLREPTEHRAEHGDPDEVEPEDDEVERLQATCPR